MRATPHLAPVKVGVGLVTIVGLVLAACSDGGTGPGTSQHDLRIVTGDGHARFAEWDLPEQLRVQLTRPDGSDVFEAGVTVEWAVRSGGGTVVPATGTTNSGGRASARWTLGPTLGEQTVVAAIPGGAEATFTARAVAAPGPIVFSAQPPWDSEVDHLFTVQPDGSELMQLFASDGSSFWPRWSPDGSRILTARPGVGLVLLDERGTPDRVLVDPPQDGAFLGHSWAPDGSRIVFAARRADASCEDGRDTGNLYVLEVETGTETRLTSGCDNRYAHPDWSRNGEWIVYDSRKPTEADVMAIRPDGSDEYSVVSTTGQESVYESPRWEPGTETFAVTQFRTGGPNSILTLDLSGAVMDSILVRPENDAPIVGGWSPDGTSLVFTERRGQEWIAASLDVATGETHALVGTNVDAGVINRVLSFPSGADWSW